MTFGVLLRESRAQVDERLATWLAPRVEAASAISPEVGLAAEAARDLTLRGGKRMRAALVAAGFMATAGTDGSVMRAALAACASAMIAIELLQTYLLIHDDWMDGDAVRRGGPAVHVVLSEKLGRELGGAGAILAGDLASGWAQAALLESTVASERALAAARAYARINVDVVSGQIAEMTAHQSSAPPSVDAVHTLKTASYTTTGPLLIGAALAGASDAQITALERFGRALGVAFQLRDDLLGTFGDPAVTGKPIYNDVRTGKRTALVAELLKDADGARVLASKDVEAIVKAMESGAKSRVEARIQTLLGEARAAAQGDALLEGAVAALGDRAS
jgi:geranylgeranyl diphosphate synthase type I